MASLESKGPATSGSSKMPPTEASSSKPDEQYSNSAQRHSERSSPSSSTATPSAVEMPAPTSTPSTTRRPYQPQFTAMTETILQRIRNGNASISSAVAGAQATGMVQLSRAKYEDARRRLVETLKTSDNIELPAVPTRRIKGANSKTSSATSTPTNGSLKRKRSHLDAAQDHGSPFSDADLDAPQFKKMAPRAPARKKKAKDDAAAKRCSRCDRQAWTEDNMFITCPRCEENWHLLCNPPDVVKVWHMDQAKFKCFGCLDEARQMAEYQKAKSEFAQRKKQHEIARTKEKVMASLPIGVTFDKPDLIGFGAGGASDAMRTEYFSSMSRRDLLSLLAFCDKLRPNLLVDLLVTATKKHSDLPIFHSPDWAAQVATSTNSRRRALSIDPGVGKRSVQNSPANPATNSAASTPAVKQAAPPNQIQTIDGTDAWDDDDDFLPPSWPKEGEGMYSALPPESEDLDHLVDEDEDGAFQGFMVKSESNGSMRLEPAACC